MKFEGTSEEISFIDDLVDEVDEEYPEWNAMLVVPKELWKIPLEWIIHILKQKDRDRPDCLGLYGNTDSGKTTFLDHCIPSLIKKYGLNMRYGIIKVSCLTNTTLKGLFQSILQELDWRFPRHSTIQELEPLVGIASRKRNCQLIIIDEFSQLEDKVDDKRQNEVLKALRNISKQTYRPLMIVGVKKILNLLAKDSETNTRFFKVEFPRFELEEPRINYFRKTIKALDEQLLNTTGIISDFATNPYAIYRLFKVSKGKIGSFIKLYEWTVRIALKNNISELSLQLIDKASYILEQNEILVDDEVLHVNIPLNWEGYSQK